MGSDWVTLVANSVHHHEQSVWESMIQILPDNLAEMRRRSIMLLAHLTSCFFSGIFSKDSGFLFCKYLANLLWNQQTLQISPMCTYTVSPEVLTSALRVWRTLHTEGMYPYYTQHIQHLETVDMCSRLELCRRINPFVSNVIYIYIYGAHILDVSRSHTTTHHSR